MNFIEYLVTLWYFSYHALAQTASSLLMLPNDRCTLDDCHLRYNQLSYEQTRRPVFAERAYLKEFAHIGAIGWTQPDGTISWNCGGTLIWDNFVLTAAHCAVDSNNKRPDVIRFGDLNIYSSDDDEYAQQLKIIEVIRHPEHRYAAQYHDIALMKLEKNVTLHETVVPACLWADEEMRFRSLEAAGWGKTGYATEKTPVLLKVSLKPMDNEECGKIYTNDTNRRLRFGLQDHHIRAVDEKMDTCEGDSGGPLQV
ncbi:serine protease snake-like [Wyeomyia smithii]|uniref:serine protease snake-like n=1 Tax=Wyeomyia smithii TaxID=174621 RepID=UPI002467E63A|nr:serine protease snake-like [Wyeomyia smithii]